MEFLKDMKGLNMLETLTNLDGSILIKFQHMVINDSITSAVKIVTHLGDKGIIWIALVLLLLIPKKTRKYALLTIVALGLTYCVNNLFLKNYIDRTRPYETFDAVQRLIAKQHDASFPSGHAASSFVAAVSFYIYFPKKIGIPAIILAIGIALSRLYVGVHYPGDILAGAIIGSLFAWLVSRIYFSQHDALHPAKHSK